jgi:hypothetical protein
MALRLIRALPGEPGFVVTITGVMRKHHRRLDANHWGVRTTRFHRARKHHSSSDAARPSQPAPRFVTVDTPLSAARDARITPVFCAEKQLTRVRQFSTTGKSANCCQENFQRRRHRRDDVSVAEAMPS